MIPGGPIWREAASVVGTWDHNVLEKGNLRKQDQHVDDAGARIYEQL